MKKVTDFQDYTALCDWTAEAVQQGDLPNKTGALPPLRFADATLTPLVLYVNGDTVPATAEAVREAKCISLVYSTLRGDARIEVRPNNTAWVSAWLADEKRGVANPRQVELAEDGVLACFEKTVSNHAKLHKAVSDFDPDLFCIAVRYLIDSQGTNIRALAHKAGVDDSGLAKFLKGTVRSDGSKTQLDLEPCRAVCHALGAKDFRELYAMGERAARENPLDKERFKYAVLKLIRQRGYQPEDAHKMAQIDIIRNTGINQGNFRDFLYQDGFLSAHNCHLVREALGAKNFRELYEMGGVPLGTPVPHLPPAIGYRRKNDDTQLQHEGRILDIAIQNKI